MNQVFAAIVAPSTGNSLVLFEPRPNLALHREQEGRMKRWLTVVGIATGLVIGPAKISVADESAPSDAAAGPASVKGLELETLLSAELKGLSGTEVIVSRVTIPPNTALPRHWHPGEEFAYVLEGSVVLWQEGKPDTPARKGDVVKVPLRQVHTAITKDEGATILVFRVHEQGKPERIPVE